MRPVMVEFVEGGTSPAEVRRRNRARHHSSQRKWKVAGTPGRDGSYARPIEWSMTVAGVVADSADHDRDNAQAWTRAML
jgi:hypothetical protein